jgi:hypothetical protein
MVSNSSLFSGVAQLELCLVGINAQFVLNGSAQKAISSNLKHLKETSHK